ncbi:MAG: hypothetical protein HC904_08565 [Blastochloris sp.]|nr:hypothetical protein [Blastochloris sp.]
MKTKAGMKLLGIGGILWFTGNFLQAESIVYPSGAAVVNVRTLGATGNGATDDTVAIQNAINNNPGKTIYFPNGTYLVSNWIQAGVNGSWKRTFLQGQSKAGTIIRLAPNTPGFTDPALPKPVITFFEGTSTGQAFRNSIRNLTIDTGANNPGAIGLRWMNNNQGAITDVVIKSTDSTKRGVAGLDLTKDWPGPAIIRNLSIDGFDKGVLATKPGQYSITMENLTLTNQKVYGIHTQSQIFNIRGLTSVNTVPVIYGNERYNGTGNGYGQVVILNGNFSGGSATATALDFNRGGGLYLRNITCTGYQKTVSSKAANGTINTRIGNISGEFVSEPVVTAHPSPTSGLNLPIEDTPTLPWEGTTYWSSVTAYGAVAGDGLDDTSAIQAALNSGKTTIYFPKGSYHVSGVLTVPSSVKVIMGMESSITVGGALKTSTNALFRSTGTGSTPLFLERLEIGYGGGTFYMAEQASARPLVMRSLLLNSGSAYKNSGGANKLYVEDVTGAGWRFSSGQSVWARQINPESGTETNITNNGATLWILGVKTEKDHTVIHALNGARTELLGGYLYISSGPATAGRAAFLNQESQMSLTYVAQHTEYTPQIRDVRGGVTVDLVKAQLPQRQYAVMVPLFSSRPNVSTGLITVTHATVTGGQNLTTLGTLDWIAWGRSVLTSVDRKATGGSQISNWTAVGTGHSRSYNTGASLSWTDGSPSSTASSTGLVRTSGVGNGLEFTVPSGTTQRTLHVFSITQYNATGLLRISLDDNSAPVEEIEFLSGGTLETQRFTIQFKSATSSKLRVRWVNLTGSGNLGLRGAAWQ